MASELRRPHDPEKSQMQTLLSGLAQELERELISVELGKRQGSQTKSVYDSVYLPIAVRVADGMKEFSFDLSILRLPLWEELAATQLRVVLEVLYHFTWLLSE